MRIALLGPGKGGLYMQVIFRTGSTVHALRIVIFTGHAVRKSQTVFWLFDALPHLVCERSFKVAQFIGQYEQLELCGRFQSPIAFQVSLK